MALVDFDIGIIIFIFLYAFSFSGGMGSTLWIYSSEVLDSLGCSVVAVANMFTTWVFATFSNLGFKYLSAPGMFFGLTFLQL